MKNIKRQTHQKLNKTHLNRKFEPQLVSNSNSQLVWTTTRF